MLSHYNKLIFLLIILSTVSSWGLCVNRKTANLRTGPGTQYRVGWMVGKHMPLRELKRKGSWIQVADLDGEKYWVNKSVVSDRSDCVVVKVKYTYLRTGPGPEFKPAITGLVDKYYPFKNLGGEDGWIQVVDDYGQKSWVSINRVWSPNRVERLDF